MKRTKIRKDGFWTFDIETTTIITGYTDRPIREGIIWSGQFYDGNEYIQERSLKDVIRRLELIAYDNRRSDEKRAIFVHNLSYEFQFIKDFFKWEKILCTDERKIISAETDKLIFRCSYFLSNMSLSKFLISENVPEEYLKSQMDYLVNRYPWTDITPEEEIYCRNDVIGLHIAIQNRINKEANANINYLPLTSTGYVRKDCRKACANFKGSRTRFFKERPDVETFEMLHEAFRGGNTHANKDKANKVLDHVGQKDIQSSYPGVLLLKKYPTWFFDMKPFSQKEFNFFIDHEKDWALLIEISFKDLKLKNPSEPVPYISANKTMQLYFNLDENGKVLPYQVDNGRILECAFCSMIITEQDYIIIRKQYEFDEKITRVKVSKKKHILQPIREMIMKYYTNKTTLKQDENSPDYDPDIAYMYARSKALLNGIYGMHVTNPCRPDYVYDNDSHMIKEVNKPIQEMLDDYYSSFSNFLSYQVGVWVPAYGRRLLQEGIDLLWNKKDPSVSDLIYCDTDSLKYLNPEDHEDDIAALNSRILNECEKKQIYVDFKGKRYYMGIFTDEGIVDHFKTFGAKKYMYGSYDNFKITISGVPKKLGHDCIQKDIKRGKLNDPFEVKTGYVFHDIKNTSEYRDHTQLHSYEIDGHTVYYGSNIAMYPSSYTLNFTHDYELLINKYKDIMEG